MARPARLLYESGQRLSKGCCREGGEEDVKEKERCDQEVENEK